MAEKTVSVESGRKVEADVVQENEMGTLPIGKLLRKMSLPLIIPMLVQVLYGLVDSMYVTRLGDSALTAISFCMPVQYLAVGIGLGLGVGVNSVLSKKPGEGDKQGVNRAAGNGMLLIWLVSIVFVLLGFWMNLHFNKEIRFERKGFLPDGSMVAEIIKVGVPVALSQCLISVLAFGMNNILLSLSAVTPGIYVLYIRLQSFVIVPAGGMSTDGISIIAYNFGTVVFLAAPQLLLAMFDASQAVFLLLSTWLLSLSGSAVLVWLAFPLMEIARFFIGVFMVRRTYKKQIAVI